jgi:hypothetical protein
MKKFLMGLIIGAAIMLTGSIYADEGMQKVEAYLRPTLPIILNGQAVTLESSPVMYDGSTYLKLRDVAALTGLKVNWNDATQTVELGKNEGGSTVSVVPQPNYDTSSNRSYDIPTSGDVIPHEIGALSDSEMTLLEFKSSKLNDYMQRMQYIVESTTISLKLQSPDSDRLNNLLEEAKTYLSQDEPNIEKMQILILKHGLSLSLGLSLNLEKKMNDDSNKKWETEQLNKDLQKVKYDVALYTQEINKRS